MFLRTFAAAVVIAVFSSVFAQEAPVGSASQPDPKEKKSIESLRGKVQGVIAWSSSRSNSKHDIWVMNADGTGERQLTKGDEVDWFPRISPDGATVLFVRSKDGWVSEGDADVFDLWDVWTIPVKGGKEKMVAENCCWGTWLSGGDSIVIARGAKVLAVSLINGSEKELFDAEKAFKKGTIAQQPSLSPDGKLIAMTLRGTKRDCGIWNPAKNEWHSYGGGCEIEWFPSGLRVLRVNEGMGNGSTEVLSFAVDKNGKPAEKIGLTKSSRLMDLPGRRSHEYFPKLDPSGTWLVWAATQEGHEHDIADYEIFLWNTSTDKKKDFIRLTFHSGNDRWPDVFTKVIP